jgi:hypothetical protein
VRRGSALALDRMEQHPAERLKEDRSISVDEAEVVRWLLVHAPVGGALAHLVPTVKTLRVVGRCSCGCPSVDFEVDGQTLPAQPIADATGQTADGTDVGVILWGRTDVITGLECYERGRAIKALPLVATLQAW